MELLPFLSIFVLENMHKNPHSYLLWGNAQIIDMLPMHRHQQCHHTFQYNQNLGTVL